LLSWILMVLFFSLAPLPVPLLRMKTIVTYSEST
jgi:hypothetical protein